RFGHSRTSPMSKLSWRSWTIGESGIRTHGRGLPYNGFQDRLLKPLGHLSKFAKSLYIRGIELSIRRDSHNFQQSLQIVQREVPDFDLAGPVIPPHRDLGSEPCN